MLWLFAYLMIGGAMLWACGMLLAGACLNLSRNGMFLSEGIAGIVYLLSGVVFPLRALPECPSLIVARPFLAYQIAEVLRLALQEPYWMTARPVSRASSAWMMFM